MRILRRVAYWLRLSSHDADLLTEVEFHRAMVEDDLVRRGMSPAAARIEARRTMGNDTVMREQARAVWLWPSLEALWQDATYTLRDLRRNPTFTIGVTLTLALGIGANAAMFSLIDRLLFRAPAYMVDPSTVQRVYMYRTSQGKESGTGGQYARYSDLARYSTAFSQIAGVSLKGLAIGVGEGTRVRNVAIVSAGFFGLFDAPAGARPVLHVERRRAAGSGTRRGAEPRALGRRSSTRVVTCWGPRCASMPSSTRSLAWRQTGSSGCGRIVRRSRSSLVATYGRSEGSADWATTYGHAFGIGLDRPPQA